MVEKFRHKLVRQATSIGLVRHWRREEFAEERQPLVEGGSIPLLAELAESMSLG